MSKDTAGYCGFFQGRDCTCGQHTATPASRYDRNRLPENNPFPSIRIELGEDLVIDSNTPLTLEEIEEALKHVYNPKTIQTNIQFVIEEAFVYAEALRMLVAEAYDIRGFEHDNPWLLLAGLVEEVGEVAEALNVGLSKKYKARPEKRKKLGDVGEAVAKEVGDVLTYALALCTHFGVSPTFAQWEDKRILQNEEEAS